MKKIGSLYLLIILFTFANYSLEAQKIGIKSSTISFFSDGLLEDIAAVNTASQAILNLVDGAFVLRIPITSFEFPNQLMQEHFNENYVESDDYPKCTFQGKFDDWDKMDANKDGKYTGTVSGIMNLHGQDQPVNAKVTMVVDGKNISIESMFYMVPEDYKIEIPSAVRDKIADKFEVSVKAEFKVK